MKLLGQIKSAPLLSFRFALNESNEVSVGVVRRVPKVDRLELVRFWAFATAKILYEVWFTNTPPAFKQRLQSV